MNITQENTGNLTATLKVELEKKDYQQKVDQILKDHQKKSNMPGFRPGKVPMGMIKKMFGKSIVADEVNKIISESLQNYIVDNNVKILGHPLPSKEKSPTVDFESDEDMVFYFDIGLSPDPDIELSEKIKIPYYDIQIDDKTIDKQISDVKKRHGQSETPEEAGPEDILRGQIVPADDPGTGSSDDEPKETTISLPHIKDKKQQSKFIGAKKGEQVVFNPLKATGNEAEAGYIAGNKAGEEINTDQDFRFTVNEIVRIIPAEMNQELFDKTFPQQGIQTEEAFREKIAEEMARNFQNQSDQQFMKDAIDKLIEESGMDLPDEFLKRWLLESNENKITKEQVEKEYSDYSKAMRWQLLENKIAKDYNLQVGDDEVRAYIRNYFIGQMGALPDDPEADQRMESIIDSVMQNKEEVDKVYEQLLNEKVKNEIKEKIKLKNKKISHDDFIKLATKK
ncbi:MAG: trigger factor [Bacteroidales bacterium]